MSGIIKKLFIVLLTSLVNVSSYTKCVSLSNQKCQISPNLINLHPNKLLSICTIQITVSAFVIFSVTYLIKYMFQIKQKI